jgi:histidinol-phosphate aminotransferase
VLDEAYADFAAENALALALAHPHVLVARTFSKAFSLCFQRVGYLVGHRDLVAALDAIRDSYNVNGLGQMAAVATLEDLAYYRANIGRVVRTRNRLAAQLTGLGFDVVPSETNFLFVRPPRLPAGTWLRRLRDRKVLVRWFNTPGVRDYLRITVGTDREAAALVRAVKDILT